MKRKPNTHKQHVTMSGLTIVESLVAISILVIAVLGPIVIVSQALRTSFFARDQLTAYYLAQEAIEVIRNLRDENALSAARGEISETEWLRYITYAEGGRTPEVSPQLVEPDGTNMQKYQMVLGDFFKYKHTIKRCPLNICEKLDVNINTGMYEAPEEYFPENHKKSIYTREIVFYKSPGDTSGAHEVVVEVTVSWQQVGGTYQFKLRETLLNWQIQTFD